MLGNCHFIDSWMLLKEFQPRLKKRSDDDSGYCNYCMRYFSVTSCGISQVRQHSAGKLHLSKEKAANRQIGLIASFLLPVSTSNTTLTSESTSISCPTSSSRPNNQSLNPESRSLSIIQ